MRIIIILSATISLLILGSANCQAPLVDGIEWEYEMYSVFGSNDLQTTKLSIVGDTIIQNQSCKILEREHLNCNLRPKVDYLYQENGKLFYYHFQDSLFHLLYDYGAEVGDTMKIRNWKYYAESIDYFYLRVDSVSTIDIGDYSARKLTTSYGHKFQSETISFYDYDIEIIEGIGNPVNFFYWQDTGFCDGNHVFNLRCYYHPHLGNYGELEECGITISAESNPEKTSEVSIYPNPFIEKVNLEFEDPAAIYHIKIYNSIGHIVYRKDNIYESTQLTLDTSFPNGLYRLAVKDAKSGRVNIKTLFKK